VFGPLRVDPEAREITVDGDPVVTTRTEFDLLDVLTEQPRRVLSREQLRERVWGGGWFGDDHAVDVHVSNLRRKLAAAGAPTVISTVRGVGYRLAPELSAGGADRGAPGGWVLRRFVNPCTRICGLWKAALTCGFCQRAALGSSHGTRAGRADDGGRRRRRRARVGPVRERAAGAVAALAVQRDRLDGWLSAAAGSCRPAPAGRW
jgi:DNA-binding winged helix-turn-helix (wHTH) protein